MFKVKEGGGEEHKFRHEECGIVFEPCMACLRVQVFVEFLCKFTSYIWMELLEEDVGRPRPATHDRCLVY